MRLLVVNAGSSSLKLSLVDSGDSVSWHRELGPHEAMGDLGEADAVAHRIVHGGERFREAVRIDDEVVAALDELADLAPLHQRKSLDALRAVSEALPGKPAVACFDTSFHATLPAEASTYALPAGWRERWPLRRYGFHGLSHAWIARRVPERRVVSCHLGAGASLCAIDGGRSVDTTMGFTPLEGLVMATRSGSVDPGLVLWLLEHEGLDVHELAHALEHESGLLGLGGTADMRELLERSDEAAQLALGVYVHRVAGSAAAMAAALGGLDALAFTGGVGERAAQVRARVVERLAFLGIAIDAASNERAEPDADVSVQGAAVRTWVIAAREDLEIARQARAVLG